MCLGIPMKIVDIKGDEALVSAGGLRKKADISLLKDTKKGDYVLIHAGFAIEKIRMKEARATLRILRNIDEVHR